MEAMAARIKRVTAAFTAQFRQSVAEPNIPAPPPAPALEQLEAAVPSAVLGGGQPPRTDPVSHPGLAWPAPGPRVPLASSPQSPH